LSASPARRESPPRRLSGPVETAVGLVPGQALPARPEAWPVLRAHLLGVDGSPPVPAADRPSDKGDVRAFGRARTPVPPRMGT